MKVYKDVGSLRRTVLSDWSTTWDGWQEAGHFLHLVDADVSAQADVIHDCIKRFCSIALANVTPQAKSDCARRNELHASGKVIGEGLVFDENACLADSLLQLLAAHGFLARDLCANTTMAKKRRKDACQQARLFLVNHADPSLRPLLRDALGNALNAEPEEHARAFLEHDRHAMALTDFFLDHFGSSKIVLGATTVWKVWCAQMRG